MQAWREFSPGIMVVDVEVDPENPLLRKTAILSQDVDSRFRRSMERLLLSATRPPPQDSELSDGDVSRFPSDSTTPPEDGVASERVSPSEPDMILVVGDRHFFPCHSLLVRKFPYFGSLKPLATPSPSTPAHFRHFPHYDLTEDVSSPLYLETFLRYFYKGVLFAPPPGHELGLFRAAKKLGLKAAANMLRAWMGTYCSVADACELLERALSNGHYFLYETLVKIVEHHATVVFRTELFLGWSKRNMMHFLEHANLQLPEIDVFRCVVKWCHVQAKRILAERRERTVVEDSLPSEEEIVRTLFRELEQFIRYALIGIEEYVSQVEPLHLVSSEMAFETYKYFSLSGVDREFAFRHNPRTRPRGQIVLKFGFSSLRIGSHVTIMNGGQSVTLTSSTARTIVADTVIRRPGLYYFAFCLTGPSPATSYAMFGLCHPANAQLSGYLGNCKNGWALYACNGNKYHASQSEAYTTKLVPPVTIGLVLDALRRPAKLYFLRDDEVLGEAFRNVTLPVTPAVTITNRQEEVSIVKNTRFPKKWK